MINIDWLEPWEEIDNNNTYFDEQLIRELSQGHLLYGLKCKAIGRRGDCDDVVYEVSDVNIKYAIVHLTYSNYRTDNRYPRVKIFDSLKDFQCEIEQDHNKWI